MPPVQPIRSYIEVQPLIQLTQFNRVSSEQIVKAYQITDRLKETIVRILNTLAGERGPQMIAGQRGAGKTHLMTIIRALMMRPALASLLHNIDITNAANKMLNEKFFVIELHLNSDDPPDLFSMLREELAARDEHPLTFSDSEWEASMMGEGVFRLIKSKLPENTIIVLMIDGISAIMRSDIRMRVQFKRWLLWAADRFKVLNQSIIITMDDDLIDNELSANYQISSVDIDNQREIADRSIFRKTDAQRREIANIYNDLRRLMPQFEWSKEAFISLFPIHPAVLEVAPYLRIYSRSFTFFGFITSAAPRALSRKAYNLTSLDELFDSFEFDLRKHETLAPAFAAYDQILQMGLPNLSSFDEKVWGKMAAKALFIYSLLGQAVSLEKLSCSVLLYDERDPYAASQKMRAILGCFISTVPKAIEVTGEGSTLACRFKIGPTRTPQQIFDDIASSISDDDPRLANLLIGMGGNWFVDWPFHSIPGVDEESDERAELSVDWRGTQRRGIFSIGAKESELRRIDEETPEPTQTSSSSALAHMLPDENSSADEDDLPIIEVLVDSETEMSAIKAIEQPPVQVCEYDWQVSILPIYQNPPQEMPDYLPPSLYYWQPHRPSMQELDLLKHALVLKIDGETLTAQGIDCHSIEKSIGREVRELFYRLYIEQGHFLCPATHSAVQAGSSVASSEDPKLNLFLSEMVADGLDRRYPEHPVFKMQLTEYELLRLTAGLFGGLNPSSQTIQSYAEAYALPLQLVENSTGEYKLALDPEHMASPVAEILQRINSANHTNIALSTLYIALRREPYGLQIAAQRLILLALTALWKIELADDTGTRILSASQLSSEVDLSIYKNVRQANINYPPQLLSAWGGLIIGSQEEIDLISAQGRRFVRDSFASWLQNWHALALSERIETLSSEMMTTRIWQMTTSCRKYFENIADLITQMLNEEISLEACISRIIDIFNAKEAIYIKAVHELTMLVNFLDWLPFYEQTRKYILTAERTGDEQIDGERRELADFLSHSNMLLDEEKRQRYESVYSSFHSRYSDHYSTVHDATMNTQQTLDSLTEYLASDEWREFEALARLTVSNPLFYNTALEIVRSIRERGCSFPVRELLQTQPHCACSFRLNTSVDANTRLSVLRQVVEQGITYHRRLVSHYLKQMRFLLEGKPESALTSLLGKGSTENGIHFALSTVEEFNNLITEAQGSVGLFPTVRLGGHSSKQELRAAFEKWLDSLPDEETGMSIEFLDVVELYSD